MKQNRILVIVIIAVDLVLAAVCMTAYFREDRVQPEFRFQTDEDIYNYADGEEMLLDNITAYDDRDGDISDRIVIEKITENRENSTIVVYYAVSDSTGNVAKISRVFLADFGEQESVIQEDVETFSESPSENSLKVAAISGKNNSEEDGGNEDSVNADGEENTDTVPEDISGGNEDNAEADNEDIDDIGSGSADGGNEDSTDIDGERTDGEGEETGEEGAGEEETVNQETSQPPEPQQDNVGGSPMLTLRKGEVTIDAGTSPPWTAIIETLWDDKDNYETLYYNLSISSFNRNQPGDYPVSLYTQDSDGNLSNTVSVMVHVK